MGLQCLCSKKEDCWKNGGSDDQCVGDYSLDTMFTKLQHCMKKKVIISIFTERVSDTKAIIVGYVPNKACFCTIVINHDETIEIVINFYGQFSRPILAQSPFGSELYDELPGNNKGGGSYVNNYITPKKDAGNFNKLHCIVKSDYMFSDCSLKEQCKNMIERTDDFLSEFICKTYAKLATQFRCQYVSMFFLIPCDCNGLSAKYCDETNVEIAKKLPSNMFSDKTKRFVGTIS